MKKYPEYMMKKLRQRLGLDSEDISKDDIIMTWSKNKVFEEVCNWEGLVNWGHTLQWWLEDIYGIDFKELE